MTRAFSGNFSQLWTVFPLHSYCTFHVLPWTKETLKSLSVLKPFYLMEMDDVLVLAAITGYHILGVLNNLHLFLRMLEVENFEIRLPPRSGCGEGSFFFFGL
jgi:hypothetical protein